MGFKDYDSLPNGQLQDSLNLSGDGGLGDQPLDGDNLVIGGLGELDDGIREPEPEREPAPVIYDIPEVDPTGGTGYGLPDENVGAMRGSIKNRAYDKYQTVPGETRVTREYIDEEYQPGMHDASVEGVPQRQGSVLKAIGLKILPVAVAGIFLLWYFSDFISFSGGDKGSSHVMSMEDEEYKKILAEKEDMARRLEISEIKMTQERKEIEDRFERMLQSMQEAEAERARQQNEAMERIRAEMKELAERERQAVPKQEEKKPEPVVKAEPLRGSATPTGAYNAVAEMRERKAAAEAALAVETRGPLLASGHGLATATMIPARLDTRLVSLYQYAENNFWAVATTTEDITVSPGFILPRGARFLGKARPDYAARRMVVDVERMQYGTTDIAVKGMILDQRKNAGLVTKYVDPKQRAMWSSLIPNLLSAMASSAKDLYDVEKKDSDGYRYTEKRSEATAKNVALDGLSNTFQDQARLIEEINREKPSIIIVETGTPVFIQITEFVGADLLHEGGFLVAPK